MFDIFKKEKKYTIIKLFKIVDINKSSLFPFKACANLCLDFIKECNGRYPNSYSINFDKKGWKSKNTYDKGIEKREDKDIVELFVSDGDYYAPLVINNDMMNSNKPPLYSYVSIELSVEESNFSYDSTLTFISKLYDFFAFDYGYISTLEGKFDLISERKFKKGLFSISIAGKEVDSRWHFYTTAIINGYIRKLYPINFLNKSHLEQIVISELLSKNIGVLKQFNSEIWTWELNEKDFVVAEKALNKSRFVIINDSNTKLFIENPEVKIFYEERKEERFPFGN